MPPRVAPRGRQTWVLAAALAAAALGASACRQDMHNQPKIIAYRESDFFADGRGMRPIPEGTVARGFLEDDDLMFTGKVNGQPVDEFPFPVTRAVLDRGKQRFEIYCTPCHGRTGVGNGMVVQRGYKRPPSFFDERVRALPVGYYFDVMTNGFGAMPDYKAQVAPEDRWAIASYIRVLQLSERASLADVPEDKREELDHPTPKPSVAPAPESGQGTEH